MERLRGTVRIFDARNVREMCRAFLAYADNHDGKCPLCGGLATREELCSGDTHWRCVEREILQRDPDDPKNYLCDGEEERKVCGTCEFSEGTSTKRLICNHPKVFGTLDTDDDGAEQWEAAEIHFGPNFGCIHYKENKK